MIVKQPVKLWAKYGGISASVVASYPVGRRICIMVGKAWWILSPPEITWTLCHASFGLNHTECIFSTCPVYHPAFASVMVPFTVSCKTISRRFASDGSHFTIPRVRQSERSTSLDLIKGRREYQTKWKQPLFFWLLGWARIWLWRSIIRQTCGYNIYFWVFGHDWRRRGNIF